MRTKKEIERRLALLEDFPEDGANIKAEELRWVLGPNKAKPKRRFLEGEQFDLIDSRLKKKVYFKK